MLAKTLPLLLLSACASTPQLPTADQPKLAQMAQSYAQQLQAVVKSRVCCKFVDGTRFAQLMPCVP